MLRHLLFWAAITLFVIATAPGLLFWEHQRSPLALEPYPLAI